METRKVTPFVTGGQCACFMIEKFFDGGYFYTKEAAYSCGKIGIQRKMESIMYFYCCSGLYKSLVPCETKSYF